MRKTTEMIYEESEQKRGGESLLWTAGWWNIDAKGMQKTKYKDSYITTGSGHDQRGVAITPQKPLTQI